MCRLRLIATSAYRRFVFAAFIADCREVRSRVTSETAFHHGRRLPNLWSRCWDVRGHLLSNAMLVVGAVFYLCLEPADYARWSISDGH
jgi:hypothetical protein